MLAGIHRVCEACTARLACDADEDRRRTLVAQHRMDCAVDNSKVLEELALLLFKKISAAVVSAELARAAAQFLVIGSIECFLR
jgi:hypothetical protein